MAFGAIGLQTALCDALARNGIHRPTAIQELLLPAMLSSSKDLMVRNVTGSGKSFGAALGLLSSWAKKPNEPQDSKQIAPTHIYMVPHGDLACQVEIWLRSLVSQDEFPNLSSLVQTAYNPGTHISTLPTFGANGNSRPHILIGTPTRLLAHLHANELAGDCIDTLLMDEVDQMTAPPSRYNARAQLNRLKHPKEIEELMSGILASRMAQFKPPKLQSDIPTPQEKELIRKTMLAVKPRVIALSATTSSSVRDYLKNLGWIRPRDYAVLDVMRDSLSPTCIQHISLCWNSDLTIAHTLDVAASISQQRAEYYSKDPASPIDMTADASCTDIASDASSPSQFVEYVIKYCQHHRLQQVLVISFDVGPSKLIELFNSHEHVNAQYASEFVQQTCRSSAQDTSSIKVIVLSAEATRGLHFENATHLFMIGAPKTPQQYLHAAGRVGRLGKQGTVISFVASSQAQKLAAILRSIKAQVARMED